MLTYFCFLHENRLTDYRKPSVDIRMYVQCTEQLITLSINNNNCRKHKKKEKTAYETILR